MPSVHIANLISRCQSEISERSRQLDRGRAGLEKFTAGRPLTFEDRKRILVEMRRLRSALRSLQARRSLTTPHGDDHG